MSKDTRQVGIDNAQVLLYYKGVRQMCIDCNEPMRKDRTCGCMSNYYMDGIRYRKMNHES